MKISGRPHNEARNQEACELKIVQVKRCPIVWIWVTRLTALFGLQKDLVYRIKGAHLWFLKKSCRYAFFLFRRKRAIWQNWGETRGTKDNEMAHPIPFHRVPSVRSSVLTSSFPYEEKLRDKFRNGSQNHLKNNLMVSLFNIKDTP